MDESNVTPTSSVSTVNGSGSLIGYTQDEFLMQDPGTLMKVMSHWWK